LATNKRLVILTSAFEEHPKRFVRGTPRPPQLPDGAWINKPKKSEGDSEFFSMRENVPIEGKSTCVPAGDRRSWTF
jgi:hypothetical protein